MTTQLESQSRAELANFVKNHPKVYDHNFQIEGEADPIRPVYRIPLRLVRFNIANGRYSAERRAKERELGHSLDRFSKDDQTEIRKLLKEENRQRWEDLKADIKTKGQQDPAIVTAEGDVINGNRRLALLQELYDESSDPKFDYIDALILPEHVSEKALWRIEAGIQLSQPTQLEYGPINNLLKLREGIESGMTAEEMEAVLIGMSADRIREDLERLELIDQFLTYKQRPEDYSGIQHQRLHEYFIDLQNAIKSWRRDGVAPTLLARRIQVSFDLLEIVGTPGIRFSHTEYRHIKEIYSDQDARQELEVGVNQALNDSTSATSEEKAKQIKDAWDNAREAVNYKKMADRPIKLAQNALNALKRIDPSKPGFNEPELARKLRQIEEQVSKLQGSVSGS